MILDMILDITKGYQQVSVAPLGWKRHARNFSRFGWKIIKAEKVSSTSKITYYEGTVDLEEETVYLEQKSKYDTLKFVDITIKRDSAFASLHPFVSFLESLFKLAFKIRALTKFLMIFGLVAALLIGMTGYKDEPSTAFLIFGLPALLLWLIPRIIEDILSFIAKILLK